MVNGSVNIYSSIYIIGNYCDHRVCKRKEVNKRKNIDLSSNYFTDEFIVDYFWNLLLYFKWKELLELIGNYLINMDIIT